MMARIVSLICFVSFLGTGFSQSSICPTGKYGDSCELNCDPACFKSCNKVTGACDACITGKYGSHCAYDCTCGFGCDQETGVCSAACGIFGCGTCGSDRTCSKCAATYEKNSEGTRCCSEGCKTQGFGVLECENNGTCSVSGCDPGFWGRMCTICSNTIENCELCELEQGTTENPFCRACIGSYQLSDDSMRCCPEGCDDCRGDICSVCKSGYYIYGDICDTCGNNCQPPGNGSARCDTVTGRCLYGCLPDWHGLQCDVECTLSECKTCHLDEFNDRLTCVDCNDGFAPDLETKLCGYCNPNCVGGCDSSTGSCIDGCIAGYRGDRCDQSCADAGFVNCTICGRYDDTCSECFYGYWGQLCEQSCSVQCTPSGTQTLCDKDTAACVGACLPGYWQDDCQLECPNCLGDLCSKDNGVCTAEACKSGWWGEKCDKQCPSDCAMNPSTLEFECDFQDGRCQHGCDLNQYGPHCIQTCHPHCGLSDVTTDNTGPLCAQYSGECKYGCELGYYWTDCSRNCTSTCVTGMCNRTKGYCLECDNPEPGWLCADGTCEAGKQGEWCQSVCPAYCAERCERYSGKCDGCLSGFYGDKCNVTCSNCLGGECKQKDGECETGCNGGYFDPKCETRCLFSGCETCNRQTGQCETCKVGLYGDACQEVCSSHCTHDDGINPCDKATGTCQDGSCEAGWWGLDCFNECNNNCKEDGDGNRICYYKSGNCSIGCKDHYWGSMCDNSCSSACQEELCDRDSTCMSGCTPGYFDFACHRDCDNTCNNGTCGRYSGVCDECSKPLNLQTELCRSAECESGSKGLFCNEPCPENCAGTCHRYNSTCDSCKPGYYGRTCTNQCGQCTDITCVQSSGTCDVACNPGYYGDLCVDPCKHDGCLSCGRESGECLVCKPGLYGNNCSLTCSDACPPSDDNLVYCVKDTGACREGLCVAGWYGAKCDQQCPVNCNASENTQTYCDFEDGSCDDGCKRGWFQPLCDEECGTNCFDGICNRTGYCSNGCNIHYYGYSCDKTCSVTCSDSRCDRVLGDCAACKVTESTFVCRKAECPVGSKGLFCNETCPVNCVDKCDRYNATCTACDVGFYGDTCADICAACVDRTCAKVTGYCEKGCLDGMYGPQCNKPCPLENCQKCQLITGTCDECKPGYYGVLCDALCSDTCKPSNDSKIRCDRQTGYCSEKACQAGYYLDDCSESCNEQCGADFNQNRPCHIQSGACSYDCEPKYYGDRCDRQCSDTCVGELCNRTGYCVSGCMDGYYREDCRVACAEALQCHDGTCDRINGNCTWCDIPQPTPLCKTAACPAGMYGVECTDVCPINCLGGTCIRETGLCEECIPTWHGNECEDRCLHCKEDVCFQSSGNCIMGCQDGYYTELCNTPCLFEGCQDCVRDNGTCKKCKEGKYGIDCSKDCSQYCTGRTCNIVSGVCDSGACVPGYWSETCRSQCSPHCDLIECDYKTGTCSPCTGGWFGPSCKSECSPNCKNNNCTGTRDTCLSGCATGFWGNRCEKVCNENCVQSTCERSTGACSAGCNEDMFYGSTCKDPCHTNCLEGICERNGYCREGCQVGSYGDKCDNTCPLNTQCTDGTCDRKAGNCSECDAPDPNHLCPSAECPNGKWGTDCKNDCPSTTCIYGICMRDSGICKGCHIGVYGTLCDKECGKCKLGTECNQITAVCEEGCRDGFYGELCDKECNPACRSCERYPSPPSSPSKCLECTDNRWGVNCENGCNANCKKTIVGGQESIKCFKDTGFCYEGACADSRFWKDDCSQECPHHCNVHTNGYRTCYISDGVCSRGCENTYYGPQCMGNCSLQCKNRLCENSPNNCVDGCAPGFYNPPSCSGTCSPYCKIAGNCNPGTGVCIDGCEAGYFGDQCIVKCYGKCLDGTCDNEGSCPDCKLDPVGDNCHPKVCAKEKYGASCETECPGLDKCIGETCHRQTGKCPQGCKDWIHGEYCTESCVCNRDGTLSCDQSGTCHCKTGRTGFDCSESCSDGCLDSTCNRNGVCTYGCKPGRFGSLCENTCNNCVDQSCDATTGYCLRGCVAGTYGTRCDDICPVSCTTCDSSGQCTQCIPSRYGLPNCVEPCSTFCSSVNTGRICSESTGNCIDGCIPGYWGQQCREQCGFCLNGACSSNDGQCREGCQPEYYSPTCKDKCSSNCAAGGDNNYRECQFASGACRYGCELGFYGPTCLIECNERCLGRKCSSATMCTDGCETGYYSKDTGCDLSCYGCSEGRCDDGGICAVGCNDRLFGTKCTKECSKTCRDGSCDQTTGQCADCSATPVGPLCRDEDVATVPPVTAEERLSMEAIIAISASCAGAVIIIAILAVCCVFYRRQASDAKNEIHLPSDVLERLSTHRSHHSTISSQYPVARVVGDDDKDFVLF